MFPLFTFLWHFAADAATPAKNETRTARIARTAQAPVIDGVLDDEAWKDAEVLTDFIQRIPFSDVPASDATEIRLTRDEQNIYVYAYMKQDPSTIRHNKLRRHDNLPQDDTIEVIFDTFHDHLRGYIFLTNANGAKHDTQVDGYKGFNNDWHDVWDVRASILPDGWCAEFRIPVRVMRFQPGTDVWGFQVQRRIQYKQEYDYWSAVPKQYDGSHLGYAGNLSGFADLRQQRNLQVIPALIPTRLQAAGHPEAEYDLEPSLDVKYVMGSNATLDFTANTDFAQVEADDTQVNLTRFSLFFPEKREFFLESASVFDFGIPRDTQVFFSRRIGISNGSSVPIFGGARLTQKVGRFDVGLMDMQTQDSPAQEATNYSVARVRRNLRGRSTVGAIFTNAVSQGYDNQAFGIDTSLWLSPNVRLYGFASGTRGSTIAHAGTAHLAAIDYQTDPWGLTFSEKMVGAGFDPGIGFVLRKDIRDYSGSVRRRYRLNREWSRNVDFTGSFTYLTDTGGRLLSRLETLQATNVLPSGAHFDYSLVRQFEQLTKDFNIMPPIVIPMAAYRFTTQTLTLASANSRRISGQAAYSWGSFYGGSQQEVKLTQTTHFSHHFRTSVDYQYDDVRLPQGNFNTTIARLRVNYSFNPDISISGLIQWNSTTGEFSANVVFRLIYGRDSNFYVVYNERQIDQTTGWALGQRAAILKLTYRLYL